MTKPIGKEKIDYRLEEFKGSLDGMGMDEKTGNSYQKHYKQGFNIAVKHIKEEFYKFFPNI
jgi:hypothetical protein